MAYDCGGAICTDATDFDANGNYTGSDGSSGFNWNNFADSLANALPGILGGSAALYNATHGQQTGINPATGLPYPAGYYPPQPVNNSWLYVGGAIFALILVIALVFLFTRK